MRDPSPPTRDKNLHCPLQWKGRILTISPPGMSYFLFHPVAFELKRLPVLWHQRKEWMWAPRSDRRCPQCLWDYTNDRRFGELWFRKPYRLDLRRRGLRWRRFTVRVSDCSLCEGRDLTGWEWPGEVKEESEKVGLKLIIQKTKIMASGRITSW